MNRWGNNAKCWLVQNGQVLMDMLPGRKVSHVLKLIAITGGATERRRNTASVQWRYSKITEPVTNCLRPVFRRGAAVAASGGRARVGPMRCRTELLNWHMETTGGRWNTSRTPWASTASSTTRCGRPPRSTRSAGARPGSWPDTHRHCAGADRPCHHHASAHSGSTYGVAAGCPVANRRHCVTRGRTPSTSVASSRRIRPMYEPAAVADAADAGMEIGGRLP